MCYTDNNVFKCIESTQGWGYEILPFHNNRSCVYDSDGICKYWTENFM